MSDPLDWNAKTIAEFRANEGRVGGNFEGAPMALLHHRGRKSGREHVTPVMYLPDDTEPDIIYVFATKAGAPRRYPGFAQYARQTAGIRTIPVLELSRA
jgi:F420H(2)-dependent quinone reductase